MERPTNIQSPAARLFAVAVGETLEKRPDALLDICQKAGMQPPADENPKGWVPLLAAACLKQDDIAEETYSALNLYQSIPIADFSQFLNDCEAQTDLTQWLLDNAPEEQSQAAPKEPQQAQPKAKAVPTLQAEPVTEPETYLGLTAKVWTIIGLSAAGLTLLLTGVYFLFKSDSKPL